MIKDAKNYKDLDGSIRKKIKRTKPGSKYRRYKGSAGYDLFCDDITNIIPPLSSVKLRTGIAVKIPQGHYGKIASCSGMAFNRNIRAFHGTIDNDYRGEIMVILDNRGKANETIIKGQKIAQLVIIKISTPQVELVVDLELTKRGKQGCGVSDTSKE